MSNICYRCGLPLINEISYVDQVLGRRHLHWRFCVDSLITANGDLQQENIKLKERLGNLEALDKLDDTGLMLQPNKPKEVQP